MNKNTAPFRPTLLDYAILGLIQDTSRSGYGIRKVFETTALGIYSSSPGSIYPALKRLVKRGLVEKKTIENTSKSQFHITQNGLLALKSWLLQPIEKVDVARNREELFLRFAFMENLLSLEQKLVFLTSFHSMIKGYLKELKAYHRNEAQRMPVHGRLSFEHGIATYQTTLQWCKKAMTSLQQ